MFQRDNSIDYLRKISGRAQTRGRLIAAREAIEASGVWEEHIEWRISTVTSLRIEAIQQEEGRWFKVSVRCDAEMIAVCPTLERAVEYAGIFEYLHSDLFWTIGWPSWAAPGQLSPGGDAG